MEKLIIADPEVFNSIEQEHHRQQNTLEMIASENFTSPNVMEAVGSVLTNKYAEGYPGKRYYGGCEAVDIAENIARDRAKKLFQAEYANVQPHSGSQANMAIYLTFLKRLILFGGRQLLKWLGLVNYLSKLKHKKYKKKWSTK